MKVSFTEAARRDIAAIYDYISRDNPEAAKRVVAAIERATDWLSPFPFSGRMGAVEEHRYQALYAQDVSWCRSR